MNNLLTVDWPNAAADGGKVEDEVMVEVLTLLHVKSNHFHNTQQGCANRKNAKHHISATERKQKHTTEISP